MVTDKTQDSSSGHSLFAPTPLLVWSVTPWMPNGRGGWKQQPIILVEGRVPFFADHPQAYIDKLRELHDDPALSPGVFHTMIGQFQDCLELTWETK